MARWTQNPADEQHLSSISKQMPFAGLVEVTKTDGSVIEGVLRKVNMGNNAGAGGWKYYGECDIETKTRQFVTVDYLDLASARAIWNATTSAEYESLGLISIARN